MATLFGWLLLILGVPVLIATVTIFRLLASRSFPGRYIYLARGLALGGGMICLWYAVALSGGAFFAWLGILGEMAAGILTIRELRRKA
jgi:hypothetical protein